MQDAGTRWLAAAAVVAAVATGCGNGGGGEPRTTAVRADATAARPARVTKSTTTTTMLPPPAAVVTAKVPPPTTGTRAAGAYPGPPPPPVVTVSVAALQSGSITRSDGQACSNVSSQTLAKGRLELRRSGSTAVPLTVRYSVTGAAGDFTPLPGSATIPAGAVSAPVEVTPTMTFGAPPQHVHRSSSVSVAVLDDPAYDLGAPANAGVTLTFDVDVYGCDSSTP